MQISFLLSKTDIFYIDITLIIAAIFDKAYVVVLVKNFFAQFSHPQNSLLFDLDLATSLIQQLITKTLRSYLRNLGYKKYYSDQFFVETSQHWLKKQGLQIKKYKFLYVGN